MMLPLFLYLSSPLFSLFSNISQTKNNKYSTTNTLIITTIITKIDDFFQELLGIPTSRKKASSLPLPLHVAVDDTNQKKVVAVVVSSVIELI